MKKLLSMALVLMMVLTLFAVPTMAASMIEGNDLIIDGGFDSYDVGEALQVGRSVTDFSAYNDRGECTIVEQGDNQVLLLYNTQHRPRIYSNNINYTAGKTYKVAFDVYIISTMTSAHNSSAQPYTDLGGFIQLELAGTVDGNVTWGAPVVTAEGIDDITYGTNSSRLRTIDGLPGGKWLHVEVDVTANQSAADSALFFELKGGYKSATEIATPDIAYIDNISFKEMGEGYGISVTEVNDFGTVVADSAVMVGNTATIKVIPEVGYYLHSATLNGEPVEFTLGTEQTADTGRLIVDQCYTYTLAAADLTEDAEFEITYGQYQVEEVYPYGNAEAEAEEEARFTGAERTTADKNGGEYSFYYTSGKLMGPTWDWMEGEKYVITWDAKMPSPVGDVKVYGANTNTEFAHNGRYYATRPGYAVWTTYQVYMDIIASKKDYINFQADAATYFDNISVKRLTPIGVPSVEPPAPATYNVTISGENAVVSVEDATVTAGETTTFTVAPKFGYYIQSITVGGEPFAGFKAYEKDTYTTEAINANTEIVVTTAALADSNISGVSNDIATLPAVFAPTATSAVTFGKVLDNTVDEYGIYLTKDGDEVVTATGAYGPYFAADAALGTANGQFAIEFIGLEAGEYTAKTYVKVGEDYAFGVATTFTVD
ncbi:MAG: hypothetical protein IJY55_01360 [Clostridia bacterium]|nr:hypothetical protein [Clostridia bacterium]